MCCSMTCWDCMIMQDSDIIVSSRPDITAVGLKESLKIKGSTVSERLRYYIFTTNCRSIMRFLA